jgi:flagellar FliJ protein
MKKFRYRLQALLKVKEHIERERQKEHGAAAAKVMRQKEELSRVDDCKEATIDDQRKTLGQRFTVADMLVYSRYVQKLRRDRVMGEKLLEGLSKDAEEKRRKLVEASQEKRKYEKLRDRQKERHAKEAEHLMAKDNDETALNIHRRKDSDAT